MSAARCVHGAGAEIRRRDHRRAQMQCLHCGRPVGRAIAREEFSDDGWRALGRWERRRRASQNSRARAYRDYLRSAQWKATRRTVIERAGGRCQGESCTEPATTAHHVRYAKVIEQTPLADLRASCARCNLQEREQRIASGGRGHA